jgi:hypothetical protein
MDMRRNDLILPLNKTQSFENPEKFKLCVHHLAGKNTAMIYMTREASNLDGMRKRPTSAV